MALSETFPIVRAQQRTAGAAKSSTSHALRRGSLEPVWFRRSSANTVENSKPFYKGYYSTFKEATSPCARVSEDMADTTTSTTTVPYSPKSIYGNRYVVHDHLGTGRYGKVYLCSDRRKEHTDIVLKVPYQATPTSLKRHRREAKIMRHLSGLFIDHIASSLTR